MRPLIKANGDGLSHPERIADQSSSEKLSSQEGANSSKAKSKDSDPRGPCKTYLDWFLAGSIFRTLWPYFGLNVEIMKVEITKALTTKFPNEVSTSVMKLVCLGLYRENNLQKIETTILDEHRKFIRDVTPVLGLVDSSIWNGQAVTLTRVCICFPEVAMKVAHYSRYKGPAVKEVSEDFPSALRPPFAGGMIPSKGHPEGLSDSQIAKLRLAFIYYFFLCIHKTSLTVDKTMFESQMYVDKAIQKSAVSESRRHKYISDPRFEILDDRGLKPIIAHYAECALAVQAGREVPK